MYLHPLLSPVPFNSACLLSSIAGLPRLLLPARATAATGPPQRLFTGSATTAAGPPRLLLAGSGDRRGGPPRRLLPGSGDRYHRSAPASSPTQRCALLRPHPPSWINSRIFSKPHLDGVNEFMTFWRITYIFMEWQAHTYTRWIHHEEPFETEVNENVVHLNEQIGLNEDVGMNEQEEDDHDDRLPDMVKELFNAEDEEEMKKDLYPSAAYTRFSFVVKFLHIKSFYRISNEAKKLIRALGLGYESIHVCPNNCVLFRKAYEKNNECPICGASRWKDANGCKRVPQKVLWHFPIIPRLRRIFCSRKLLAKAQWHKLKKKPVENELSHSTDGEAWKDFDKKYEWFAEDARNIRLGLATYGFNPFGKMSASYSMWPIFLIPYNFPLWECMEQSNFMMCLLIPGKESLGKDIDLFLEPLIEELLELWRGVSILDALTGKSFDLHVAVIWCIHDYIALNTLSSRVTRGYYACVH
ncbi:hypothetical protein U9M48_024667 [Paspalum notatum var. saurae]|uniref:Transposase n=1 Tax=Paspalum notatum var. saurae TaxID=547442 RepID=A0AAQ3TRS5_PASNO